MGGRKRILTIGVVVVLLAVGGYAYADTRGPGTNYRTVVAKTATVERTLSVSGTVGAAGRRDLAFGTSGTVKKVLVEQGQHVQAGQVIAKLDRTALRADVVSAEATLAKARAQLVSDQSSSSSSGSSGGSGGSGGNKGKIGNSGGSQGGMPGGNTGGNSGGDRGGTGTAPGTGGTPVGGSGSTPTKPVFDMTSITAAQTTLTTDTQTLTTALNDYVSFVENTCTTSDTTASGQPCDLRDPGPSDSCPASGNPSTLVEAKVCVANAQSAISGDATALTNAATQTVTAYQTAVQNYGKALVKAAQAEGKSKAGGLVAAAKAEAAGLIAQAQVQAAQVLAQIQKQTAAASKNGSGGGFGNAASGDQPSKATLEAQDQAQIASAKASLASARQSARAATMRAPISGKVVDVAISKGDSVTTSDTAVTVLGKGATTVEATVTLAQVPDVKAGQSVSVTPAGWNKALSGTVTTVGLSATTSSSGTTTYPITVTIKHAPSIPLGVTAAMAIVTGEAKDAVTVPTSAVTRSSRTDTVTVLEDGKATTKQVKVGLVGASRTTIKSGLKSGDVVVIADLDAALPSGDSSSSGRRNSIGGLGGGGGGFRGPPGGFGGR